VKAGISFLICVVALTFGCSSALAQARQTGRAATQPPPRPLPTPLSPAEAGRVTGSIYRNTYFGFQLKIPQGWVVQGEDTKARMKETSKTLAVNKDQKEKAATDAAVERTANLLTISKLPIGTVGQFNALFSCIAEPLPLSMNKAMYMAQLKRSLQSMTVPVTVEEEGGTETIGGAQYSVLTILMSPPQTLPAKQKYYVTLKKGYAVGFVSTIFSESDAEATESIIRSISFQ
jgi:hypothetical protein